MTTISCKQCGFENETQRIYCHNCGVKLDRSSLPQENKPPVSLEKEQRRLKRLTNPGGGFFTNWPRCLFESLVYAMAAAALIQSVRPPDGAPAPRKKGELIESPQIMMNMEDLIATHQMQKVSIEQSEVNAYLFTSIKPEDQDLFILGKEARFDCAYATFDEGSCEIRMRELFYGYPFYIGSRYQLEIKDGKLQAKNVGGSVGRMPLHPLLMQAGELAFGGLWDSLKREKALLDKLQAVEVHKGRIILVTKGDLSLNR